MKKHAQRIQSAQCHKLPCRRSIIWILVSLQHPVHFATRFLCSSELGARELPAPGRRSWGPSLHHRRTPAAPSPRALSAPARLAAARPPGRAARRPRQWSGFRASCRRARGGGGRAALGRGGGGTCCARGCAVRLPPLQFARAGAAAAAATTTARTGGRRDAALPAHRGAMPGLRLLLAPLRLQPARRIPGGRSGRRWREAAGRSGFLARGRRTRRRKRGGQRGPRSASQRVGQVWAAFCVAAPGRGAQGRGVPGRGAWPGPGYSLACPAPPAAGTAPPASLLLFLTPFTPFPPSPRPQGWARRCSILRAPHTFVFVFWPIP